MDKEIYFKNNSTIKNKKNSRNISSWEERVWMQGRGVKTLPWIQLFYPNWLPHIWSPYSLRLKERKKWSNGEEKQGKEMKDKEKERRENNRRKKMWGGWWRGGGRERRRGRRKNVLVIEGSRWLEEKWDRKVRNKKSDKWKNE